MSYQEKKSILSMITSTLIFVIYCLFIYGKYGNMLFGASADFRVWGTVFLILIPVSIVVNIVAHIVFIIFYRITTQEEEPSITDERDKMIELKAMRNSFYTFIAGFMTAMASLVFGMPVSGAFVILFLIGFLSSLVSDISEFVFYRRGF